MIEHLGSARSGVLGWRAARGELSLIYPDRIDPDLQPRHPGVLHENLDDEDDPREEPD